MLSSVFCVAVLAFSALAAGADAAHARYKWERKPVSVMSAAINITYDASWPHIDEAATFCVHHGVAYDPTSVDPYLYIKGEGTCMYVCALDEWTDDNYANCDRYGQIYSHRKTNLCGDLFQELYPYLHPYKDIYDFCVKHRDLMTQPFDPVYADTGHPMYWRAWDGRTHVTNSHVYASEMHDDRVLYCRSSPSTCSGLTDSSCLEYTCNGYGTCLFQPSTAPVTDRCRTPACVHGAWHYAPVLCTTSDPCLEAYCDPLATGSDPCATQNNTRCDDGNLCTHDACDAGRCLNTPHTCNDGDPCTDDVCDDDTGECVHTDVSCDDGDACTVDICLPDSGLCVHEVQSCDDADPCTTEYCVPQTGECVSERVSCNDNDPCTDDYCVPAPTTIPLARAWLHTCHQRPITCRPTHSGADDDDAQCWTYGCVAVGSMGVCRRASSAFGTECTVDEIGNCVWDTDVEEAVCVPTGGPDSFANLTSSTPAGPGPDRYPEPPLHMLGRKLWDSVVVNLYSSEWAASVAHDSGILHVFLVVAVLGLAVSTVAAVGTAYRVLRTLRGDGSASSE